ncbi:hypothetical protein QTP70_005306 [Hemibagrus guttatus]|uniref:ribonuclease H n=1 Tax=Hemibagrus guttatus TaxID=175788 RepID=A0AAE0UML8_9TELE|nr:hypothetical protein QTP70_005306 [Hemibagrus guttatus]
MTLREVSAAASSDPDLASICFPHRSIHSISEHHQATRFRPGVEPVVTLELRNTGSSGVGRIARQRKTEREKDIKTEENRQEYKELQRRVKREVSKAKQKAYDELYTRLDTREGEKDLYRLARQRDRDGMDVQQVRLIKDRVGRVLTSEESVQRRWKEYFEELMNEENEREKRVEGVNSVEQKEDKIRKDEVRKALKRMKSGKAVGPDDIPVEVWRCLGEAAVEYLTSLFNRVLESEKMSEEWRKSMLVLIFKNKGDVQSCSNYRGIKLMSHTMKLWEREVEARLRKVLDICEQKYGFMPRKSTTDTIFALRILMEKYRESQKELHCVFVDLEKAYDRVPREELWYCMRKSGVAEKYVRVVQDMYERSRTVVRCAVGQTEEFKVEVGLHQGSALSPFLFAIVMDQLSEEVRQESPWTSLFADDIVICSESREQVEENLERWRFALERRGMKVSHTKTEYMCVNEREGSGTVRLQGEEVKKTTTIIPVLKKSIVTCLNHYRPFAFTPIMIKCFKRLIMRHIKTQLLPLLDPLQFVHHLNRSKDDTIATILQLALTHLDNKGTYVQMLFIDFSSAFNTIIPQHLTEKLSLLGLNTSLCNWILDFLTGRPQSVQIGNSITTMHNSNHIIKFADDTTVVGLISMNDESAYREEVQWLTAWCKANNLYLNVDKTKEMVVDLREHRVTVLHCTSMDPPWRLLRTPNSMVFIWQRTSPGHSPPAPSSNVNVSCL